MSNKLYLIVSGAIFLLVGIFHLFRLVYHARCQETGLGKITFPQPVIICRRQADLSYRKPGTLAGWKPGTLAGLFE
jgi:hypothetical protein